MKTRTIVFYSYKGGTGRTLLLANYAEFLVRYAGKRVLMLDFDLEAPGLHFKFPEFSGNDPAQWAGQMQEQGLIDLLQIVDVDRKLASNDYIELCCRNILEDASRSWNLIPAGQAPGESYANKVLTLNWRKLLPPKGEKGIGRPFFEKLKKRLCELYEPDVILIDSRTGITDIGTVALRFLADQFVCLFLDNKENIAGTRYIIGRLKTECSEKSLIPVLSRVGDSVRDLNSIKKDIGLRETDRLYQLHNDLSLQTREQILVGSDKTLWESVALRNYYHIIEAIDPDSAKVSPIFEVMTYLSSSYSDEIGDSSVIETAGIVEPVSVLRNIRERSNSDKEIRIAGAESGREGFNYITDEGGNVPAHYCSFVRNLANKLAEIVGLGDKKKPVKEDALNWGLLGLYMEAGIVDFCDVLFHLSPRRSLGLDVVRLGKMESYTALAIQKSKMRDAIVSSAPTGGLTDALQDRMQRIKVELADRWNEVKVGMIVECPFGDDVARSVSYLMPEAWIESRVNSAGLAKWLRAREEEEKGDATLIVCDYGVASRIAQVYKECEFAKPCERNSPFRLTFEKPIPTGLAFGKGDRAWRAIIIDALSEVVRSETNWSEVAKDLEGGGVTPVKWEELKREIILGKTPDKATDWIKQIESCS